MTATLTPIDDAAASVGAAPGKRLDIQGLRAIAVVLVVVDHLSGWPGGGFIGVDIFFVISGFLITGILLREGDKTQRVLIGNFYRRRARRILPAALLTIAVTVTASYLIVLQDRFDRVVTDAWWSLGFMVNWHFASVGTDYFQSALPPSPLQHFWSLAVEEQFYLAWPVMLAAVLFWGRRSERRASVRVWAGGLAVAVIVVSFAWAMVQTSSNPTVAYFSTFTRTWELAVGALLAVTAPRLMQLGAPAQNGLAAIGLAGIGASAIWITADSAFPGPTGALPVLATAAVLASGVRTDQNLASAALRWLPIVYVGTLSYSIYLWHWPVIVLLGTLREKDATFYALAVGITLVASMLSYHLVEAPVLKSEFLAPAKRRRRGHESDHGRARGRGRGFGLGLRTPSVAAQNIGTAAVAIAVGLVAIVTLVPKAPPPASAALERHMTQHLADEAQRMEDAGGTTDWLASGLTKALQAPEFPGDLVPALNRAVTARAPQISDNTCINDVDLTSTTQCTVGSGNRLAVIVGDSVALSWMPGIIKALQPKGYRVRAVTFSNCPFTDVSVALHDPEQERACNGSRSKVYKLVRSLRPDLVITSGIEAGMGRVADGGSSDVWAAGVSSGIRKVATPEGKVVVLAPPPAGLSPAECAGRFASPDDCESSITAGWFDMAGAEAQGAKQAGAKYVDTRDWFCVDDRCPLFALGTTIRWDPWHLTANYAEVLAPKLRTALLGGPKGAGETPASPWEVPPDPRYPLG